MNADIATRRRVLLLTYRRYLAADREWVMALREVKTWFPVADRPCPVALGDPGSPLRRIHDHRDRAIRHLHVARLKLEVARQRLAEKDRSMRLEPVLFIGHDAS